MLSSQAIQSLTRRLVLGAAVALLSLVVIGMLIAALLLAFLEVLSAPLALLSTAGVLLLIVGVLLLAGRRPAPRPRPAAAPIGGDLAQQLAPILQLAVGQKPWAAVAAATALGAVTELTLKNGSARPTR